MPEDINTAVPAMDQDVDNGSLDDMLGDIIRRSPMMDNEDNLPEADEDGTDDLPEEDLVSGDEDADEDDGEEDEDNASEDESDEDDDESAQDDDEDDGEVDWDFKVPVKIDGEESEVTLDELRKGYSTQQHLTKQGQELGNQRKTFEKEKNEKLAEMAEMSEIFAKGLLREENKYAEEYAAIKSEIDDMRKNGDKYELAEKKDELEQIQEKYWTIRNERENSMNSIKKEKQIAAEKGWQAEIQRFNETVTEYIPDYNKDMGEDIRKFALEEGIPENIVNSVTNPIVVKILNDYRIQKNGLSKGKAKRKAVPAKKATPTKKATPAKVKAAKSKAAMSKKIQSGSMSEDEQMDFLRGRASNIFN